MSEEVSKFLREWCLEVDAPLLEDDLRLAADTIERLLRERDEARAEIERLTQSEIVGREVLLPVKREQSLRLMQHAEAAGYRKGVEDAAKFCKENAIGLQVSGPYTFYYDDPEDPFRWHQGRAYAAAILALLEQTEPGEKK